MIIVEITIASMKTKYDFEIDANTKLSLIMQEIYDILSKKTGSPVGKNAGDFILCDVENSRILNSNLTVAENGVKNGSKLLLL